MACVKFPWSGPVLLAILWQGLAGCSANDKRATDKPQAPSSEQDANSTAQPAPSPPPSPSSDQDFSRAGQPTLISGAYLTAYRDPPAVDNAGATVTVYGVVTDKTTGKPLPKPIDIASAELVLAANPAEPIAGTIVTDPSVPYHVIYAVPRSDINTQSPGTDVVAGQLQVVLGPASDAAPDVLATSQVTWLANLALQADQVDYGGLRVGTPGVLTDPGTQITFHVIFSGAAIAAQNATLQGLGDHLAVLGGSCPALAAAAPATLAATCDITVVPTSVGAIDQFVTLTYFNGVHQAYASWPIRGEAAAVPAGFQLSQASLAGASVLTSDVMAFGSSVATDGQRLVVADGTLSRVLIWNKLPAASYVAPDLVIGQADGQSGSCNRGETIAAGAQPSLADMCVPAAVSIDGQTLIVADSGNNRILIWRTLPTSSGQPADLAVGPFATAPALAPPLPIKFNQIMSLSASPVPILPGASPLSVEVKNGKLLAVDRANGTLDLWNAIPTSATSPPDFVLGPNLVVGGVTQPLAPITAQFDGTRLFVLTAASDENLLVWNKLPTSANQPPDLVLGKKTLGIQEAGASLGDLSGALAVFSDGASLLVSDVVNSRVLFWRTMPTASDVLPDLELGYDNGSSPELALDPTTLAAPLGIARVGDDIIIGESMQVLVEPVPPLPPNQVSGGAPPIGTPATSTGQGATDELASLLTFPNGSVYDFGRVAVGTESDVAFNVGFSGTSPVTILSTSFSGGDMTFAGGQFPGTGGTCAGTITGACTVSIGFAPKAIGPQRAYLTVHYADEVAEYDLVLALAGEGRIMADMVLGAPTYSSGGLNQLLQNLTPGSAPTVDARTLVSAGALAADGTALLAADPMNRRVLLWEQIPAANDQGADVAIGQPDLTTPASSTPVISASTFDSPSGIATCGGKLIIADSGANRVLIWNQMPAKSGAAADVVVGQPGMTSSTANNGGVSASSLSYPTGVFCDGTRLFVADQNNNRVLIWAKVPATNAAPASIVVGQPDFSTTSSTGAAALTIPNSVIVANGQLLATNGPNGLSIWNQVPTSNDAAPSFAMTAAPVVHGLWTPNMIDTVTFTLNGLGGEPTTLAYDGRHVFMSDEIAGNVIAWDGIPTSATSPITMDIGQYNPIESSNAPTRWNILQPYGMAVVGGKLFVGSAGDGRILRYTLPDASQ